MNLRWPTEARPHPVLRWIIAVLFVGSGVLHFVITPFYAGIVPRFFPDPVGLVYISGVFEILGGVGVLLPFSRKFASYGLIALLFAVFPANIQMLVDHLQYQPFSYFTVLLVLRLPLQFVLIALVYRIAHEPMVVRSETTATNLPETSEQKPEKRASAARSHSAAKSAAS